MNMKTIAVLNRKGGVGKTSTCFHLAGTLAAVHGKAVLLVDNDPQCSLTSGFYGPAVAESLDPGVTAAAVYRGPAPASRVVRGTEYPGIDLVAGSWELADHAAAIGRGGAGGEPTALAEFLRGDLPGDLYDLCLVDCAPDVGRLARAALLAADGLVVPIQAEDFGAQGIRPVDELAAAVAEGPNPALRHLGYLITMFDRRPSLPRVYEARLREQYGTAVWTAVVPRAIDYAEAVAARRPVPFYGGRGAAAQAMAAVARELLARLESPSGVPAVAGEVAP